MSDGKLTKTTLLLGILALAVSACAAQPAPAQPSTALTAAPTVFQTPIGPLEHTWTHLVQGVHGTIAPPGSMILLVGLRRPDGSPIDLQKFQDAHMQIFAQSEGGEKILSTMGGMADPNYKDFAIGFLVPEGVRTYTITWGENPPLVVTPD
jgi:hypothetical protein